MPQDDFPSEILLQALQEHSWRALEVLNRLCDQYPAMAAKAYAPYSWDLYDQVYFSSHQAGGPEHGAMEAVLMGTVLRLFAHVRAKEWRLMVLDKLHQCSSPHAMRVLLYSCQLYLIAIGEAADLHKRKPPTPLPTLI